MIEMKDPKKKKTTNRHIVKCVSMRRRDAVIVCIMAMCLCVSLLFFFDNSLYSNVYAYAYIHTQTHYPCMYVRLGR